MTRALLEETAELVADLKSALIDARYGGVRGVPLAGREPTNKGSREPTNTGSLEGVQATLGDCKMCGLCESRSRIVFGAGHRQADLVIVGEGPGREEDRVGEPFVGAAGQMLNKMLERVLGLSRDMVYITNVVKCRPPDNRTPLPEEIESCKGVLEDQLEAIDPKVILALGRPAAQTLLDTTRGIKSMRGQWSRWRDVPVLPTFHPAYLLRQPQDKGLVFADLKVLRARYDALGGRR